MIREPMANAGAKLVTLDGVEKSFGAVRALDGVGLDVGAGECVGIVGHNGAGKSTLMHILVGGVAPDRGPHRNRRRGAARLFCDARKVAGHTLRVSGAFALPQPDGRGERARLSSGDPRLQLAPARGRIDPRQARRDLSRATASPRPISCRRFRSAAGRWSRSPAPSPSRTTPARLVILDEPTSSLDEHTAGQLLAYIRRSVGAGLELHADLAHSRRSAENLRPHRGDARRQGRRGRRGRGFRPRAPDRRHGRGRGARAA